MSDRWRVVVKVEVECIRADERNPAQVAIISKQDSTWGAIADTPGDAFEQAIGEGFSAYTGALPKVLAAQRLVQ